MNRRSHTLKTWPSAYEKVRREDKFFEIRVNDRDYAIDDLLELAEWDPMSKTFTGRITDCGPIIDVIQGRWGLPPELAVISWRAAYILAYHPHRIDDPSEIQRRATWKWLP